MSAIPAGPAHQPAAGTALLALAVVTIAVHVLFSPWLLLAAVAILAWFRFGPRRSRQ